MGMGSISELQRTTAHSGGLNHNQPRGMAAVNDVVLGSRAHPHKGRPRGRMRLTMRGCSWYRW